MYKYSRKKIIFLVYLTMLCQLIKLRSAHLKKDSSIMVRVLEEVGYEMYLNIILIFVRRSWRSNWEIYFF
jgi:hypothetical protein